MGSCLVPHTLSQDRKFCRSQQSKSSISLVREYVATHQPPMIMDPFPVSEMKEAEPLFDGSYEYRLPKNKLTKSGKGNNTDYVPKTGLGGVLPGEYYDLHSLSITMISKSVVNMLQHRDERPPKQELQKIAQAMKKKSEKYSCIFQLFLQPIDMEKLSDLTMTKSEIISTKMDDIFEDVQLDDRIFLGYAMQLAAFELIINQFTEWPQDVVNRRNDDLMKYYVEVCLPIVIKKVNEVPSSQAGRRNLANSQIGQDFELSLVKFIQTSNWKTFANSVSFDNYWVSFVNPIVKPFDPELVKEKLGPSSKPEQRRLFLKLTRPPTDWWRCSKDRKEPDYGESTKRTCMVANFEEMSMTIQNAIVKKINQLDKSVDVDCNSDLRQKLQDFFDKKYDKTKEPNAKGIF
jgi:hypothetical protein